MRIIQRIRLLAVQPSYRCTVEARNHLLCLADRGYVRANSGTSASHSKSVPMEPHSALKSREEKIACAALRQRIRFYTDGRENRPEFSTFR